jgi:hypothetical protein
VNILLPGFPERKRLQKWTGQQKPVARCFMTIQHQDWYPRSNSSFVMLLQMAS